MAIASPDSLQAAEQVGKPIKAGDIRTSHSLSGVLFYYMPEPAASTDAAAFQAIKRNLGRIEILTASASEEDVPPYLELLEEKRPLKNFIVPDPAFLSGLGRGLEPKQVQAIQGSARVTRMLLVSTSKEAIKHNRQFVKAAHEYAVETNAVILDITTRECFSATAWKWLRLDKWVAGQDLPEVPTQIMISVYAPHKDSKLLRAATLGMEKFALPDFCVEDFDPAEAPAVRGLIELVVQLLAETPKVADPSRFPVSIGAVKNAALNSRLGESLGVGATGQATLVLLRGDRHADGSEHPMVEIGFAGPAGAAPAERRAAALKSLWGEPRK